MKIVFLGNGRLDPDDYPNVNVGGSVQTWGLCKELAKRGHEVYIVRRSKNERIEEVENIKLISVRFKGIEDMLPNTHLLYHVFLLFSKLLINKEE